MMGQNKVQTLSPSMILSLVLKDQKQKHKAIRGPACNRLRPLRLLRLLTTPTLRLKVVSKTDSGGYGGKQAGEEVRVGKIRINNIIIRKEEDRNGSKAKTQGAKNERNKPLAKGGPHEEAILGLHKCECKA